MKKVLFLLLATSISYGQALFDKGVKITSGITTDNSATKVVVQSANNVLNTISKVDLQDAFYFASASAFPVTGITDKLYIARDNNILYRFNGTIYVPLSADVSGKEDISNKSSSFTASSTVTYANTKALVDGLATKQNTITGTTNVIPKFGSGGLVGSNIFDAGDNVGIGTNVPTAKLDVRINVPGNLPAAYFINNDVSGGTEALIGQDTSSKNGFFGYYGSGLGAYRSLIPNTTYFGAGGGASQLSLNTKGSSPITFSTGDWFERMRISGTGTILINTTTDNGIDKLQVNGNITASPATLSNQVVVKSQLDLKADLASPALTGTPTAPTATAGTNTTQLATTAFVLANAGSVGSLEFNATDLTVWNNGKGNVATNTSFGDGALRSNTSGNVNSVFGQNSGANITVGTTNTILGASSANSLINGSNNTVVGSFSLPNATSSNNTIIGYNSGVGIITGTNNTIIGSNITGLSGAATNQIVVGDSATGAGSNTATLGNASITSTILRGTVSAGNATALNHLVTKAQTLYTNQTVTANKTVAISEFVNNNHLILRVDTTAGNVTITLPTFTALAGYKITVKKIDSSANSVTITGVGGINIDGASTLVVSGQYSKATIAADLVQYIIL